MNAIRCVLVTLCAASLALFLASCKPVDAPPQQGEATPPPALPLPGAEEARALATAASPAQGIELNASFFEELMELESLGLLSFNNPWRDAGGEYYIRLTEQGEAAGLTVAHRELEEQEEAFGPFGVKGSLCERVVDQVTNMTPLEGGPKPAARVHFQLRNEPTSLHALLQPLAGKETGESVSLKNTLGWCDAAERYDAVIVVVLRDAGWQVNHKPTAAEPGPSILTEREYDDAGLMVGALTTLTIPGPLSDPDGDPMVVKGWGNFRVYNSETEKIEPTDRVEVEGLALRFRHGIRMGDPEWFSAEYAASDPWEEALFEFCIEDSYIRC